MGVQLNLGPSARRAQSSSSSLEGLGPQAPVALAALGQAAPVGYFDVNRAPSAASGDTRADEQALFGGSDTASQAMGPPAPRYHENTVHAMPGFSQSNGSALMGAEIKAISPRFSHGSAGSDGWLSYQKVMEDLSADGRSAIRPVRAMCINVPIECFNVDARKFTDWTTPESNGVRVASIAALLGTLSTPLSKGWL